MGIVSIKSPTFKRKKQPKDSLFYKFTHITVLNQVDQLPSHARRNQRKYSQLEEIVKLQIEGQKQTNQQQTIYLGEVNQKEAEDYLKRPINKINDPNRSLKRAYGKKHLQDPKFNYIHTLKQLRKKREDSVSQHGDTDDEDFQLNEPVKTARKRKDSKLKDKAKAKNTKRTRKSSKQKSQAQIDYGSIDRQPEIIPEQALEQKGVQYTHTQQKDGQIKNQIEGSNNKTDLLNSSKNELLDKQNQKQVEKSQSKESNRSQSSYSQESKDDESDSKQQISAQKQSTKQLNQKDQNKNQTEQQSQCEDKTDQENSNHSQQQQKQDENAKQDLADRIKNVLHNEDQSEEDVKLTTFKKFDKKAAKGRKMITKQKPTKATVKSKSNKSTKQEALQQSNTKNRSKSKSNNKRKGKNVKMPSKVQVRQQNKVSPPKNKHEEATALTIRTRNAQSRTMVEESNEYQLIRRSSRKRGKKSIKETQLNLKGEVADMSYPPPFIEEKTKIKQELVFINQPLIVDSSQQKIEKFMVKVQENPNQPLSNIKRQQAQHFTCCTIDSTQNPRIELSNNKESQQTITNFLQQRRKSLKINNKVVVQSILCYERKSHSKHHKSKKHKYRTVIEESSDEDAEEYVVARRKHKYNEMPKIKKYRKIVIEDSASGQESHYVVGKKHKKAKRKYEDEQQSVSGRENKENKRKYKHIVDSSESKSVQMKQVDG